MPAIFYDLETTDRDPIGQILNFSFIATDDALEVTDEYSGEIRISRLQLPSAGAILTNRVDVIKHQKSVDLTEPQAMRQIGEFIYRQIQASKTPVVLIGFNSSRFDLPFLRTSFIRNGFNPYFGSKLTYRDLLLCARKLAASHADFPRLPSIRAEADEKEKLSLSLENLATHLGLLSSAQTHHSRDDTLLSIRLAKKMRDDFGLNPLTYDPYEVRDTHSTARTGKVVTGAYPNYELNGANSPVINVPMTLLDADHRSAIWVDLTRFAEGKSRGSISWYTLATSGFIRGKADLNTETNRELAAKALKEFSKITLKNFFGKSTCDIEQDIYRMDFDSLDALHRAIWDGDATALKASPSREGKILLMRFQLANYQWGQGDDQRMEKMLSDYAVYRYGGQAVLSKFAEGDEVRRHATWKDLLADVDRRLARATGNDKLLLQSLRDFYLASDIFRLAGDTLTREAQVKLL